MKTGAEYLNEQRIAIQKGLLENQSYIHRQKELHNGNIAFLAELILEELLNAIYANEGWMIKNLNTYKPNHPAIDLADKEHKVCFQITVTDSTGDVNKKIKDTLTSFYKRGLNEDYDRLFIVFASGIQNKKGIKIPPTVEVDGQNVPVAGSLITNESVNDLLDFEETIFIGARNLEEIKNVLIKIPARPEPKLPDFDAEKYIPRKALDLDGRPIDLTNYLSKEKRVVILGVGGWGKTTELIRIAYDINKQDNTFCFFLRLIDYSVSLKSTLDAYCKNWKNVPEGSDTYFILDGFDEVNSSKMEEAVNEIKKFAVENPEFSLLVSCRNNFNPFPAIENPDDKELNEFLVCYLEELSNEDIRGYIEGECLDSASFISAVNENKSLEILSNPYYLVNTIDIYNSTGRLPKTKAAFFDKLVEIRIDWERDKNPLAWRNKDEYGLTESLKNLALTMQYAGSFKISQRDFTMIVREQEIRRTIQKLFFYQEENEWRFEHNNLQEFLAAQYIAEIDWEQQKQLILLDNGKLKPKWMNAFSFLVNIAKPSGELIQYFIEKDIDSLVKTEPDKIDSTVRNDVFKRIFNKHKAENSVIWRNPYTEQDLSNFVELEKNKEVIEFLINELSAESIRLQEISNAVGILSHLKDPRDYLHQIQPLYLALLNRKGIHKYGCSREIIQSFSKWNLFSKEVKDQLIATENLYETDAPLGSLCHYLADGKFDDITGEFVHKLINKSVERHGSSVEYPLFEVIRLLSHDELEKLIWLEVPSGNSSERYWVTDLYKIICEQAIETYHSGSNISEAIGAFIYQSKMHHDEDYYLHFKPFYEATGLVESEFKWRFLKDAQIINSQERILFVVPAIIASRENLNCVIKLYEKGKITDTHIWDFLFALSWGNNTEGYNYVFEKLNRITNDKFVFKPHPHELFNERLKEFEFRLLLDHGLALKSIKKAFDYIGDKTTTKKTVLQIRRHNKSKHEDIELVAGLNLITQNTSNEGIIERSEFEEWIGNKENWEGIFLRKYANTCSKNVLPDQNIKWIKNWCWKNASEIKLEKEYNNRKNWAFVRLVVYYDVAIPEQKLLEMTSWIGLMRMTFGDTAPNSRVYNYLKSHLDFEQLQGKMLDNLKGNIRNDTVLREHIEIVKKENWVQAIEELPKYINNKQTDITARYWALSAYDAWNGGYPAILPALDSIDFKPENNYFSWYLIECLTKHHSPEVRAYLKRQIGNNDIDQIKLGSFLVQFGDDIGYHLIINSFTADFYYKSYNSNLLQHSIKRLKIDEYRASISFLIGFLRKVIRENIYRPEYLDLLGVIFEKFLEIIKRFPQTEAPIYSELDEVFEEIPYNETIGNARYHYYELKERVNIEKDKECTIRQAIDELRGMGILNEV